MFAFLIRLLITIRSRFTRRTRLEAENLILRQQLPVLRRRSAARETVEHRSLADGVAVSTVPVCGELLISVENQQFATVESKQMQPTRAAADEERAADD